MFTNTEMEQCHHIETAVGFIDSSDDEGVTTGSHIPPTKEFENSVSPIFSPIRTPIISPTNKASNIDSQESNLLHDHQLNNFSQPSVYSLHSSDDDKDVTEGIGRLSMTPKEAAPDGQKFDSSLLSISKILSNTSLHSVSLRMPTTGTVAILPTPPFEKLQDKSIKDPLSPLHSPRIRLSVSKALSTPKRFHKSQSPKTSPILVTTKGSKSIDKLLFHQSICMVCLEDDSPEDDPLVRCSGCNKVTHQHCYGIDDRNLKVWECQVNLLFCGSNENLQLIASLAQSKYLKINWHVHYVHLRMAYLKELDAMSGCTYSVFYGIFIVQLIFLYIYI